MSSLQHKTRINTSREAMMAELFGDVADLVKRVESLNKSMGKAQEAMTNAAWLLDSRVEPFRHALAAEIDKTKDIAVKAFIHQTNQVALLEQKKQRDAMTEAARASMEAEVGTPLRQFASTLQSLVKQAQRPWDTLLVHAANTMTSAAASGLLILYFFR